METGCFMIGRCIAYGQGFDVTKGNNLCPYGAVIESLEQRELPLVKTERHELGAADVRASWGKSLR